mgnify:CR=1 FL=1
MIRTMKGFKKICIYQPCKNCYVKVGLKHNFPITQQLSVLKHNRSDYWWDQKMHWKHSLIFFFWILHSELFTYFEPLYSGDFLGYITLVDSFGWNPYWVIFIFSIIAIIAFVIADFIRKRVKKVFYA